MEELHRRKRYKNVLLVADTCQAFTLGDDITVPNVMVIGSSLRGESSYAHHSDQKLGLSVIERYTHAFMQFVKKKGGIQKQAGNLTIKEAMVDPYPYMSQRAHIGFRHDLVEGDVDAIRLSDFFANNQLQTGAPVPSIHLAKAETTTKSSRMRSWPLIPTSTSESRSARRLETVSCSAAPDVQEIVVNDALPVYNPSDGPFLAIVLALLALVAILSRPR